MLRLQEKVAVITGSAHGIGFATAKRFCSEGAQIIIADVDADAGRAAAHEIGENAKFVHCDVSVAADRRNLVTQAYKLFGGLDILVNNAGISKVRDFFDVSEAEFDEIVGVNLRSAFFLSQLAAKNEIEGRIFERPLGSIVNVASIHSVVAHPRMVPYAISKGGLLQMTRGLALALAARRVRVNAVGPGTIGTRVLKDHLATQEGRRRTLERTPLGRAGNADEIACVIAFLASDDASYITGEIIYVDGGRLALNYTVPVEDEKS